MIVLTRLRSVKMIRIYVDELEEMVKNIVAEGSKTVDIWISEEFLLSEEDGEMYPKSINFSATMADDVHGSIDMGDIVEVEDGFVLPLYFTNIRKGNK